MNSNSKSAVPQRRTDGVKRRRQTNLIFPRSSKLCLPGLGADYRNWQKVLTTLLSIYNHLHATDARCCSLETSRVRRTCLRRFLAFVCPRFKTDCRRIRPSHIEEYFRVRILELKNLDSGPAAIAKKVENEISHIRFYCLWIGKPGLAPKCTDLIKKVGELPDKTFVPKFRASAMDQEQMEKTVLDAFRIDPRLGISCFLMAFFGVRTQESVGVILSRCICTDDNGPKLVIHKRMGSKGGRPREIRADDEQRKSALLFLQELHQTYGVDEMTWKGMDMKRSAKKLNKMLKEKLNLAHGTFAGSGYQFRHSFAMRALGKTGDLSEPESKALETSRDLGHFRPEVTLNYVGSSVRCGPENIPALLLGCTRARRTGQPCSRLLRLLLCELYHSERKLFLELVVWVLRPEKDRNLASIRLKKELIYSSHHGIADAKKLTAKLAKFVTEEEARQFLVHTQGTTAFDWLEENVLSSFDSDLIFR